ncbi:MAG: hypothetical protein KDI11_08745 [Alphaproteobacteria bacterium]|nr:hypothetical protein [Alphaproteobacteria bacterium]
MVGAQALGNKAALRMNKNENMRIGFMSPDIIFLSDQHALKDKRNSRTLWQRLLVHGGHSVFNSDYE